MATLGVALALCAPAQARLYWANEASGTIARAELDGTGVDSSFVTGATAPRGVAIDGQYLYWSHDGAGGDAPAGNIGRAGIDGANTVQTFIATAGPPAGLALDSFGLFWTQTVSGAGAIGRANVDGSGANQGFIGSSAGPSPCGIATDGDDVFWANATDPGGLRRSHGQFGVDPSFITGQAEPCGVARGRFIYWANRAGDSIGRAEIDGSNPDPTFISLESTTRPCGVATDEDHVYWTSTSTTSGDTVGRADHGGTGHSESVSAEHVVGPDETFITSGANGACGIAVSPTTEGTPADHAFADTAVGDESAIATLSVLNTSSSPLGVSDVRLGGVDSQEFEITGESCTLTPAPAGGNCLVNVRFAPTAEGVHAASLHVESNASDSPTSFSLTGKAAAGATGDPPSPGPDLTPPRFLAAAVQPKRFAVAGAAGGAKSVRRTAAGTTFTYSISEDAHVVFTIERKRRGRQVGGECVKKTRRNRGRRPCTRSKEVGSFSHDARSGENASSFSGRIGGRRLSRARHRAVIRATDAAGNASRDRRLTFWVVGD